MAEYTEEAIDVREEGQDAPMEGFYSKDVLSKLWTGLSWQYTVATTIGSRGDGDQSQSTISCFRPLAFYEQRKKTIVGFKARVYKAFYPVSKQCWRKRDSSTMPHWHLRRSSQL